MFFFFSVGKELWRYMLLQQIGSGNFDCPSSGGGGLGEENEKFFIQNVNSLSSPLRPVESCRLKLGQSYWFLWKKVLDFGPLKEHCPMTMLYPSCPLFLLSPLPLPLFNSICPPRRRLICPFVLVLIIADWNTSGSDQISNYTLCISVCWFWSHSADWLNGMVWTPQSIQAGVVRDLFSP